MKKITSLLLIATVIVLALAACQPGASSGAAITVPSNWNLVEFGPEGHLTAPIAGSTITLDFTKDGIGGSASCNHYGGGYEISGSRITFGMLAVTMMACDQALMDQESAYLAIFTSPLDYKLEGSRLTLSGPAGQLVFEQPINLALEGTEWKLAGIATGEAVVSTWVDEKITAVFTDGQVNGNAGCNSYFASYTLDGSKLTLGPAGMTKMACADPEVSQREMDFTTALARVASYEIVRSELRLLDADGALVMSFTAR